MLDISSWVSLLWWKCANLFDFLKITHYLCSPYWVLRVLYTLCLKGLYQIRILQISFLNLWLVFAFSYAWLQKCRNSKLQFSPICQFLSSINHVGSLYCLLNPKVAKMVFLCVYFPTDFIVCRFMFKSPIHFELILQWSRTLAHRCSAVAAPFV